MEQTTALLLKISNTPKAIEKEDELAKVIALTFARRNQEIDKAVIPFYTKELRAVIDKYHRQLTIGEIYYAFEKGVFGEYGTYYGLSVVTFKNWLDAYVFSEDHLEMVEQKNMKALPERASMTQAELVESCRDWARRKFESYKETNDELFLDKIYDILTENQILKIEARKKWELFNKHLGLLKAHNKGKVRHLNKFDANLLWNSLKAQAVSLSKKEIVTEYFDFLIESEMELEFN